MLKTIVKIDGMTCSMCEAHVNDTIRRTFSVKKVTSSHKSGITEIISENAVSEEKLRKEIAETGYKVLTVKSKEYVKKGLFSR